MKRIIVCALAAAGLAATVNAAPVTPGEALQRLGKMPSKAPGKAGMQLVHTALSESGQPAMYVFSHAGKDGGYMLLSADDVAAPLLGYCTGGTFDERNISPEMKWWMDEYARQIEYMVQKGGDAYSAPAYGKIKGEAIAPLLTTRWDQVAPYNEQCPMYGSMRTYTGCVATAMAQVMKYWNYPEVGQGSISYDSESLGKRLSLNFANRKFEWDKMLDSYNYGIYTEEEASAVAYLMKAAGYSVKMNYGADSSGALAMNIANGLQKYFNYDPNMLYTLRMYYSASEWEKLIYDNLKDVGPVLYGGGSMLGGGHSFVCDGYDGEGYFHFNWGWSGMSDGYFLLDALNPDSLGSGGGGGGGYNFTQDVVLGVQPPTGAPVEERQLQITQVGSLGAYVKDNNLYFDLFADESAMWVNYNPTTLKIRFGAIFELQGAEDATPVCTTVSKQAFSVAPGYGTDTEHLKPMVDLTKMKLSDGTYKVTFATVPSEGDEKYVGVRAGYGCYNYILLKKDGDNYTVDVSPVDRLAVKDGEIVGDLYYGSMAKVKVTIVNDNDIELTKGFAPALAQDNAVIYLGESVFVTVAPHSEVTKEWVTSFTPLAQTGPISGDTEFQLTFFDESSFNFYIDDILKPVIMKPVTSLPAVSIVGNAVIAGAEKKVEMVGGRKMDVYVVNDPMNINVESTFRLNSGYFFYNMFACVCQPDWNSNGDGDIPILTYGGYPMQMSIGEDVDFNTMISLPNAEQDTYYLMLMAYEFQNQLVQANGRSIVFRLGDVSGVDEISEELGNGEIYNLQGVSLGKDWDKLPKGIYIRNGKKLIKR